LAQAEEGLLHMMGVLRERDEVRDEFGEGTRDGSNRLRPTARDEDAAAPDRTSECRKSTQDLDRDVPTGMTDGNQQQADWPRRDARPHGSGPMIRPL
jgi:hypothetical protein